MVITVKSITRTYRLPLSASDTADSIKPFLSHTDFQAFGTTKQLMFKSVTLDYQQSLSASGVSDGDVILLVSRFDASNYAIVKIMHEGQANEVICQQDTTVEKLKKYCERKFNECPKMFKLTCGGEVLRDEQRLCDFYREGDLEIHIERKLPSRTEGNFEVNVISLGGRTLPIFVNSSMTICNVREIIYLHSSIPKDQIRLIFEGKGLSDDMIVGQLHICPGSTIHLVIRLR